MVSRKWIAPLLLLTIAAVHYSYDVLAIGFENKAYAARNIFYCLRGAEGVLLFMLVGFLVGRTDVAMVCSWGMIEEGQTTVCRIAKGIGEPNKGHDLFVGLCGSPWYGFGLLGALVLGIVLLDNMKRKAP